MRKESLYYLLGLAFVLTMSGCIVRTYPLTRDRMDQDLSAGNRGYLKGSGSAEETKERKATRTTQVIEVELRAPIKFERMPQPKAAPALPVDTEVVPSAEGNRGYLTRTEGAEMAAPVFESYTVQKNDTLQKISRKFYGTTKKWNKIYQANTDVLKAANKVYPGQTLKIHSLPKEALKEPKENLK